MENDYSQELAEWLELTDKKIELYEKALELVQNNRDVIKGDYILPEEQRIEDVLFVLRTSERFHVPLKTGTSSVWAEVQGPAREYMNIGIFPKGSSRISWSDDGRQPEDEQLLVVCFPTGAYIFGGYFDKNYPTDAFNAFFDELKSYGPKYSDTVNHSLYFDIDAARDVYWNFQSMMDRYRGLAVEENKRRKREKLEEELRKLEA